MVKTSEITKPYFSHDESASQDGKILKMFRDFRKLSKSMTREELESFSAVGAYGIFWRIVEFMHSNKLLIDDVDVLADDIRVDSKFIEMILKNYDLFRIESNYYVSDRILRNLNKQQEITSKNKTAAETRWLMSDFKKFYVEIFGNAPCLEQEDIEALKEYAEKIENFKEVLPDILYTLSKIKFDDKAKDYTPLTNWLLGKHHLSSVYEGAFSGGKLRSWKKEKERRKQEEEEKKRRISSEREYEEEEPVFDSKAEALEYIAKNTGKNLKFLHPQIKKIMKLFDITTKEIEEYKNA